VGEPIPDQNDSRVSTTHIQPHYAFLIICRFPFVSCLFSSSVVHVRSNARHGSSVMLGSKGANRRPKPVKPSPSQEFQLLILDFFCFFSVEVICLKLCTVVTMVYHICWCGVPFPVGVSTGPAFLPDNAHSIHLPFFWLRVHILLAVNISTCNDHCNIGHHVNEESQATTGRL
jgi:hypothetical protein